MGTEWGPGGEPMGRSEQQLAPNSRSSDASRSEGASSAANALAAAKPVAANGGMVATTPPTDNATIKKKRSKFLAKQFEVLTRASTSVGTTPRRNVQLLGQDYIIAVPGSRVATSAVADPDLNREDRAGDASAEPSTGSATPLVDQNVNVEKPPIEFVIAPIDYKIEHRREVVRDEQPLDYISERSPRMSPRVAALSTRVLPALSARGYASMSRSHSSVGRSPSGSERLSFSAGTPRSERSVLSVPETVISSAVEHHGRHASLKTESRTSHSSLAEWSSHSLDRRGELSIAGLSLGEGRNISGISRRTDLTSGQSPARSDTQALDYSPDDTDSGVEMYHETTSASPASYSSRRSSCNISEGWMPEFEDSDGMSHHYHRSKHRGNNINNNNRSRSPSYFAHSRSQSISSARCSPPTSNHIRSQYSPNTLRKIFTKELLDPPSHGKMRHRDGDYYDGHKHSNLANSSNHSNRRRHGNPKKRGDDGVSNASSKVMVLLGKYGRRKGARGRVEVGDGDDDTAIALDSMTPEEAIAVFHDEVARMLEEEGHQCGEAADVEEFLDGYMRLRSPFYVAMVDDFFRAVCVDCYKRPVELPVDGRSVGSSKSLRLDSHLHHFRDFNTRM